MAFGQGERMGVFRFSDFSMSPRISVAEPSSGGITLKESWIGFEWVKDENLRAELSFGTADLRAPAIWFSSDDQELEIIEAYVEGRSDYLDIRAGFLDIPHGYEGSVPEWEWMIPATRARRMGWFIRRDYGLEIKAQRGRFTTSFTVHNGESASNDDQKMWYTGLWRVQGDQGWGVLWTASFGLTTPVSTAGSEAATEGFIFDKTKAAKIRMGTMALFRKWDRNFALIEYGRGDAIQNEIKNPYEWGHVDMSYNLSEDIHILGRYEKNHSNLKLKSTIKNSYGLGFAFSSKDRLSMMSLYVIKNQELNQTTNDELLFTFRLNSNKL